MPAWMISSLPGLRNSQGEEVKMSLTFAPGRETHFTFLLRERCLPSICFIMESPTTTTSRLLRITLCRWRYSSICSWYGGEVEVDLVLGVDGEASVIVS